MSQIMVASTTDTAEAVTAAAAHGGATVTQPAETESAAAPAKEEQPETGDESETPTEEQELEEGEEESEEEAPAKPPEKKKGGFQRKIDKLTRERHELSGRLQELQRQLEGSKPAEKPPAEATKQAQQPGAKPRQDDFESYDQYIEALADWKVDQREQARTAEERQRQQAEASRQQLNGWQERADAFREKADDFDDVLAATEHIKIPQALQQALMDAEESVEKGKLVTLSGPQLAYELAKDRKELARIAQLSPTAAIRELGKFEARVIAKSAPEEKKPAVSKAPEPIRPVGQRATTSTKSPDEMSYQEYKKWRQKTGAR